MEANTDNNILNSANDYPWHQNSWNYFVKARQCNHLPHSILLSGEEGIGKLIFAKKMAKSLLCMQPEQFEACNNCQSCRTYESGANPDFTGISLLEDKQQISVEQIRELSEFLNYSRSFNTYRVVLLNPAERMNNNAANSLLKSLEEPTIHSVIILVTSQLSKIIPTIKSRCQLLFLPAPPKEQALNWLTKQSPKLENAETLLNMVSGKPLQAIDIKAEDIENREAFANDLLAVITAKQSVVEIAKKWEKYDQEILLNWQISWLQELIKSHQIGQLSNDNKNEEQTVKFLQIQSKLSEQLSIEQKWFLYQQLISQKQYIHTSVNTLIFIENMLILWLKANRTKA